MKQSVNNPQQQKIISLTEHVEILTRLSRTRMKKAILQTYKDLLSDKKYSLQLSSIPSKPKKKDNPNKNNITDDNSKNRQIKNKKITLQPLLAYNMIILASSQKKKLNLNFQSNSKHPNNQDNNQIVEAEQINFVFDQLFVDKSIKQILLKKQIEKCSSIVTITELQINISDLNQSSIYHRQLTLDFIAKLMEFFANNRLSHLINFKLICGNSINDCFNPKMAKIIQYSSHIIFNLLNNALKNISFPFLQAEYFAESDIIKTNNNIKSFQLTSSIQQLNQKNIKDLFQNWLKYFPNLLRLSFPEVFFAGESFIILSQQLGKYNSLIQSLSISKMEEKKKSTGLKNLLKNSPYLFDLNIPVNLQNSEEKQLLFLILNRLIYIQKSLDTIKILDKQGFDFQTCCGILEFIKTLSIK